MNTTPEHANPEAASGPLVFTQAAASKARELAAGEDRPGLKLRVSIQGGGCSGFQYSFSFDDKVAADDIVIERDGMQLLVDALSVEYLSGSEVDYHEDLQGSQFVIRNPNANATCGCGSSFAPC